MNEVQPYCSHNLTLKASTSLATLGLSVAQPYRATKAGLALRWAINSSTMVSKEVQFRDLQFVSGCTNLNPPGMWCSLSLSRFTGMFLPLKKIANKQFFLLHKRNLVLRFATMNLSEVLNSYLTENGMSAKRMAREVGVEYTTFWRFLQGREVSDRTLVKILFWCLTKTI